MNPIAKRIGIILLGIFVVLWIVRFIANLILVIANRV